MEEQFTHTVIFEDTAEAMDISKRLTQMGLEFEARSQGFPYQSAHITFPDEASAALAKIVMGDPIERYEDHRRRVEDMAKLQSQLTAGAAVTSASSLYNASIALMQANGLKPIQHTHNVIKRPKV